jgi:hypothetical protein
LLLIPTTEEKKEQIHSFEGIAQQKQRKRKSRKSNENSRSDSANMVEKNKTKENFRNSNKNQIEKNINQTSVQQRHRKTHCLQGQYHHKTKFTEYFNTNFGRRAIKVALFERQDFSSEKCS